MHLGVLLIFGGSRLSLEHKESMDDISSILLGSSTSLPIQISHVHAYRTDVCDLFIRIGFFLNVLDSEVIPNNSKRLLYFTHKSHTGIFPMIVCKGKLIP